MNHLRLSAWNLFYLIAMVLTLSPTVFAVSFAPADAVWQWSAEIKAIRLNATSDSGRPVCFYVREGPAEIDGDILRFTKIPPRAKFPMKITVVAWQLGASEPKLKTAAPVAREFFLTK